MAVCDLWYKSSHLHYILKKQETYPASWPFLEGGSLIGPLEGQSLDQREETLSMAGLDPIVEDRGQDWSKDWQLF